MLTVGESVKIFNNLNNEYVQAKIVPISSIHIQEIELIWKPQLKNENCWVQNLDFNQYLNPAQKSEVYVLECDSIAQGIIILTTTNYPSRLELGKNLIYLNLLTVAPWNHVFVQGNRNYKGVGTVLLTFAIFRSFYLGFQGRIALHSVKESERFFQKLPFYDGGYDPFFLKTHGESDRLKYLEMSEDEAELVALNFYLTGYLN